MRETGFNVTVRQRKNHEIIQLHNDQNMENPYIIDYILNCKYSPFEKLEEKNFQSLGIVQETLNIFTDETYKESGRSILFNLFKVLILKNRLHFSWIDSENLRKTYETQYQFMGITGNKNALCGRLAPLKFDDSRHNENEEAREEEAEDDNNLASYDSHDHLGEYGETIQKKTSR